MDFRERKKSYVGDIEKSASLVLPAPFDQIADEAKIPDVGDAGQHDPVVREEVTCRLQRGPRVVHVLQNVRENDHVKGCWQNSTLFELDSLKRAVDHSIDVCRREIRSFCERLDAYNNGAWPTLLDEFAGRATITSDVQNESWLTRDHIDQPDRHIISREKFQMGAAWRR